MTLSKKKQFDKYCIAKFEIIERLRTYDFHRFSLRQLKDLEDELTDKESEEFK
jgi:hypothetical protein